MKPEGMTSRGGGQNISVGSWISPWGKRVEDTAKWRQCKEKSRRKAILAAARGAKLVSLYSFVVDIR